ncbi:Uncharacterised protein [Burkholderia pseudomallei]|nr:Uncharacterised protein [Burkholderia pseudomallei]
MCGLLSRWPAAGRKTSSLLFAVLALFLLTRAPSSVAIGMPDIGGLLVKQALDDIDAKLSQMQANAQSGINIEESSAYQTLLNTSAELRTEMQDSLNENINNLDTAKTQALRDLYSEVDQIGDKVNNTIFTSETAVTNLRALVPFSSMPFIIYGQTPDIFKNAKDDGRITLTGNGIGLDGGGRHYDLTATVDGANMKVIPYPNRVDILVPQATIEKNQKDNALGYVTVNVSATITESCFLGLRHCDTHHNATISVPVAPRLLATGLVQAFVNKDEPGAQTPLPVDRYPTPEMSGVKTCVTHIWPQQTVANDKMVVSAGPAQPAGCDPLPVCRLSLYSTCKIIGDTAYQCSSCDEGPAHTMLYQAVVAQRVPTGNLVATQKIELSTYQNATISFPASVAEVIFAGTTWDHRAFAFRFYPINEAPGWVPITCSPAILAGAGTRQMTCQGSF